MTVGVLPPKRKLPEMPSHTNTHISGNGIHHDAALPRAALYMAIAVRGGAVAGPWS